MRPLCRQQSRARTRRPHGGSSERADRRPRRGAGSRPLDARVEALLLQREPAARRGDRPVAAHRWGTGRRPFLRRRDQRPDPGERARHGLLRDPAHLPAGEREPDGAAGHDRRVPAGLGGAHHGGDPLLRLRPRQDRKTEPRVPISSKLVANLITKAGADRVCRGPARGADPGASSTSRWTTSTRRRSSSTTPGQEDPTTRCSCRPTWAVSSARAPSPSALKAGWPSSTSGATGPTRPWS